MQNDLFLPPFLIAFLLTVVGCLLIILLPSFRGRLWRSGKRHTGKELLPRLGGVVMCAVFLGVATLDPHLMLTRDIWGLLVGASLAGVFGLWDDFYELSFKMQATLQMMLTMILFFFGLQIMTLRNPFGEALVFSGQGPPMLLVGFILLFGWVTLVMNAVNWLDGLDGLLGGVSLITFLVVFFLSLKPEVNQPPVAILASIAIGITAGFLLFNVHPAKILAGTGGSMFIGLLIAGLAVIAGTKIATALLVLSLPVADALWVIGERLRSGQSIFHPDQRHLHYKLQELGWSENQIALFFFVLTALIGLIALNTEALGKFVVSLLIFGILFLLLFFVASRKRKNYQTAV